MAAPHRELLTHLLRDPTPARRRRREPRPDSVRSRFLFRPEVGLLERRALLTQINLNPYVDGKTQNGVNGADFPAGGTSVTVGGVGFTLATVAGGGTGLVATHAQSPPSAIDVAVNVPNPTTVYALINSAWGEYGYLAGAVEFKATGGLDYSVNLVEGQDIRDYNNDGFDDTIGGGALGHIYLGSVYYGGGQVRFDKLGFNLPANFQSATLTDVILHGYGNDPNGAPWMAAATVATGSVAVPTRTALRATTASAAIGQAVSFVATVTDVNPGGDTPNGGTVTFSDAKGVIGTGALINGVAEFTSSTLPAGTINVTASYGGTTNFGASAIGTIQAYAGNGTAGYTGNNGLATYAELNRPFGLAFDTAGDLFFVDTYNYVVREVVKATGDIIAVAGNGTSGFKGDGGPATAAEFGYINSVTVDTAGDLFISDPGNSRIREVVKATGIITTIAGNGTAGFKGDGGVAVSAEINSARGIALDSDGNLFIADVLNNRIREVVKATGIITTVAGNGTAGLGGDGGTATAAKLNGPITVAVDSAGNLFISDSTNNRIREVVKATGIITTVAGNGVAGYTGDGGTATAAELNGPNGVTLDSEGDIFFGDSDCVREVVKASGNIITVAGTNIVGFTGNGGLATAADLSGPGRLAIDPAGDLFLSDFNNNQIREVTPGVIVTIGPSTTLDTVTTLTVSTSIGSIGELITLVATVTNLSAGGGVPNGGSVVFSDQNGAVGTVTLVNGVATLTLSNLGSGTFHFTVSYDGSTDYAASGTNTIITAVGDGTAGYEGDNGPAIASELDQPYGVAVDSLGDLYIADSLNNVVREVVKSTGNIITIAGNGIAGEGGDGGPATVAELNEPIGLSVDAAGNVFIADLGNNEIREVVKATGIITTVAGNGTAGYSGDGGLATAAELDELRDVAVNAAGDLFITDSLNNVVREVVKSSGIIITYAGTGKAGDTGDGGRATSAQLSFPVGVAVDAAGDLFIADYGNDAIREVFHSSGLITTVAGNGTAGYSGDGGPATAARLNGPGGVGLDAAGNLFIADVKNDVVREVVAATGDVVTFAGNGTLGYSGDGGPATLAQLDGPYRIAVDPSGDVFLNDGLNNVIREVTPGVTVTVGQLVVTTQGPANVTAGSSFSLVVTLEDGAGGTLANYNGLVTISLAEGGSGLGGTLIVTMVDGVATFSNLSLFRAGIGETLIVSLGGLFGVTTGPITVLPAQDDKLVVLDQSTTGVSAGGGFGFHVAVEDVYGNIETGESGTLLTISLVVGAGPLLGTITVAIADGVATFQNLGDDKAETVTFAFTFGSIVESGTNHLVVTPAAAAKLVLVTQPSATGVIGQPFAIQPVLVEEDFYGNLETGDNTTVVAATPAGGAGPLLGTTTAVVSGGVARFLTLADSRVETLTLRFASGTLTGATSNPVVLAKATPTVAWNPSKATAIYGQAIVLNATVTAAAGLAIPTGMVTFLDGSTVLGTAMLDAKGHASLATSSLRTGTRSISVKYAGDVSFVAGQSPSAPLYVGDLAKLDFDGDGKADVGIFDQTTATFAIQLSGGGTKVQQLGNPNDVNIPVFGDFNGDGKTDFAIFDQTTATFLVLYSGGGYKVQQLGNPADRNIPVAGDFDGDGKTDLAIFDQTASTFLALESGGGFFARQLGNNTHVNIPIAGDFDGDGKTDLAVFDQTASFFLVIESGGGTIARQLGNSSDVNVPVAGDFDGDGKTDLAIFDQTASTFLALESGGGFFARQFGVGTDVNIPVAGDFDGDGKTDVAVYDSSIAVFLILDSGGGSLVEPYGNPKHKNMPV